MVNVCRVGGCGRAVEGGGLCLGHYYRAARYGDPAGGRELADVELCSVCIEAGHLLPVIGAWATAQRLGLRRGSLRRHLQRHGHDLAGRVPWTV